MTLHDQTKRGDPMAGTITMSKQLSARADLVLPFAAGAAIRGCRIVVPSERLTRH
jgi:hypothetical protein